jgi:hypothetical protein
MKHTLLFALFFSLNAFAVKLKDYDFYNYKVLFTNPVCKQYKYDTQVKAIDGTLLIAKPKNAYCKKGDYKRNLGRADSPHTHIIDLINNPENKEIFFTFLSFSDDLVREAICENIQSRGLKVSFIIDSKNKTRASGRKELDHIKKCGAQTYFRGNSGGFGFAHNKIILTNPNLNQKKINIVFSSANMSSGTILHHENWHFVTTSKESFFAQKHLCLMKGMLDYEKKSEFLKFMKSCVALIHSPEEEDIKTYFVPGEGNEAMKNIVMKAKSSQSLDSAAHRVFHPEYINALVNKAKEGRSVRLILDDDLYWAKKLNRTVGVSNQFEASRLSKLYQNKVEVRYMESNQNSHLLHHNKFIIFGFENGSSGVHTGAGNFTKAAFTKNFENYYYITIPEVTKAFHQQYDYMWNKLVTPYSKLPSEYIMP